MNRGTRAIAGAISVVCLLLLLADLRESPTDPLYPGISLRTFDLIRRGMSEQEVLAISGSRGAQEAQIHTTGARSRDAMYRISDREGVAAVIRYRNNCVISKELTDTRSDRGGITYDLFVRIDSGMSRDDVTELTGTHGERVSRLNAGGIQCESVRYWGEGEPGAHAIVHYQNDRVTSTTQTGLR